MKRIIPFLCLLILCLEGCNSITNSNSTGLKVNVITKTVPKNVSSNAIQTETNSNSSSNNGVINSLETPCGKEDPDDEEFSYVPDIEEYFSSNSFNLERYLFDCGAESVDITSDGCIARFYDWIITIHSRSWSEIPEMSIENDLNGKVYYFDPSGDPNIGNFYTVNNKTDICEASLRKLPDLLNAFYENGFAFEPPNVYGLIFNY